ncbi:hypothetical protein GCM10007979_42550 [Nocardioides albus]|nr:hypothetical protein GCM10007979_42550 [Nocardioides albus]
MALSLAMVFAGCGSQDSDPSGDPTSKGASETTDGASTPADWNEVKIDVARVYVPPDWAILSQRDNAASVAVAKDDLGLIPGSGTMGSGVNSPSGDLKANIDDATEFHLETFRGDPNIKNVKRLPDVTINGVLLSHIQWEKETSWDSEYITVTTDLQSVITIGWGFTKSDLDRKGSQDLIDPVMETFELL